MSRLSFRVTIIDPDVNPTLENELQAWLESRCPDGIVEVRRTIQSTPRQPDQG